LKMPQVLACVGIHCDDAVGEQIVPRTVAAVLIDRRSAERHVDDAARGVYSQKAPDVDSRAILPALAGPGVVVFFAWSGDRMEGPGQLARVHVPGAYVAGGS